MICFLCYKGFRSETHQLECCACMRMYHVRCIDNAAQDNSMFNKNNWLCKFCTSSIFPFNHIDENDEFIAAISEESIKCEVVTLESLEGKMFNPFELNEQDSTFSLGDADPDLQFYDDNRHINNLVNCKYYLENNFNDNCKAVGVDEFSIIQLNVRSIPKNLQHFELFMSNLNIHFTVVCITESWLKESNVNAYALTGYKHEHVCRKHKAGGGVSLFIKEHVEYKCRTDLNILNKYMESNFIEIPKRHNSVSNTNIIIGVVYRPPDTDVDMFTVYITQILTALKYENKTVYITGDFNINLLSTDKHIPSAEFIETMYSYSFFPLISKPTRVSKHSATLIDNIFCNNTNDKDIINGIFYTDISDHFPIFSINVNIKVVEETCLPKSRKYTSVNIEKFKINIKNKNMLTVLESTDCQEAFSKFHSIFLKTYEDCFPLTITKLGYRTRMPWLTVALKNSIKNKNKLYVKYIKHKTIFNEKAYKDYKRILNNTMKKAERDHYDVLFRINKDNLKKTWAIIKEVINKTKTKTTVNKFLINNKVIRNTEEIAYSFNSFYVNIGPNLASKIPKMSKDPASYITKQNPDSIFLNNVTENEVIKIINALKISSPGWDGIHSKVIKDTFSLYIEQLVHILNLSILQGVFPSELKTARVIPIYKGDNNMIISNYRPVSVLTVFSKIFERILYNRLFNFITKHNILYKYQF